MSEAVFTDVQGQTRPDRRQNPELRRIFDDAYLLIEPFFDPSSGWEGHALEHLAFRVLREHYPQLAGHEVRILIVAATRVYSSRNGSAGRRR